jgi:hypothetical protein
VRKYPGRDSNPHAIEAVALKATVSDQFHHPGRVPDGTGSRGRSQALRGFLPRRFAIDSRLECLLGSNSGVLKRAIQVPLSEREIG